MYRSRFLGRTMIDMGYDAVAVGESDLNYGIRALKAQAEAGLPVICANLYQNGTRVFPPFVIKRRFAARRWASSRFSGEAPRARRRRASRSGDRGPRCARSGAAGM